MKRLTLLSLILVALAGCKKDPEIIPNNDPPYYGDVPTVLVRNYINRVYIDLLGREPLDIEMDVDLSFLRDGDLSWLVRDSILRRLQFDTSYVEGDTSYNNAYFHRFYEQCKGRLLEGIPNGEISQRIGIYYGAYIIDSLNGDILGMQENLALMAKLQVILRSEEWYRLDSIEHWQMYVYMLDNVFYDQINMNTFNFVNATYNDLFHRFPSEYEFLVAFDIIEYNQSGVIFGQAAQNKGDYVSAIVNTREYYEGMIIWAYNALLARSPTTGETFKMMEKYYYDHDFQWVQRQVMITDEYANF